ncbi:MAG: hypothetical protein HY000_14940 [Planctomycetes bacterium]|nr:hypothetical protein [Planctomycetota bacterium]
MTIMLVTTLFLVMNGLVFGGAALVVRHVLRIRDGLGTWLASALLGWTFIVVGLEILGAFHQIRVGPALLLAAMGLAIGIVTWWVARRNRRPATGTRGDTCSAPMGGHLRHLSVWLAGTVATWATADVLIGGLLTPVLVVSDAPIYHLYFAVRWWQSGTLDLVPTPFGESAAPYFPANGDVWFTWLLIPWSAEHVAKIGQWPFLLLGMAAVYALAREAAAWSGAAIWAAVLWGTGTVPLLEANLADVDLIMAAWYLIGTWFLLRYARSRQLADLVCFALAAGATLGTKYVALLFVPWLLIASLALVCRSSLVPSSTHPAWSAGKAVHLAVLVAGVALPCAYWYGRNWMLTGNPIYPLHVQILGIPTLQGWYTHETLLNHPDYHIPVGWLGYLVQTLLRDADPVLVPAWFAGVAGAIWAALRGRRTPILLVALGCLHIVLFWWVNPYQREDRFLISAFGLLAVPVAVVLDRWPACGLVLGALIGWHLVVPQINLAKATYPLNLGLSAYPPELSAPLPLRGLLDLQLSPVAASRIGLLATIGTAGAVVLWARRWRGATVRWLGTTALALSVVGLSVAWRANASRIANPELRELRFYPAWHFLDGWVSLEEASRNLHGDRGARVAYAGTNLPYYLFGIGLRNDVRYVNINEHRDFLMHDYHIWFAGRGEPLSSRPTPDWDRRERNEQAWLRNLWDHRIDLLFIGQTNRAGNIQTFYDDDRQGFPIERAWADGHPEVFHLVHADRLTRVYQLHFEGEADEVTR